MTTLLVRAAAAVAVTAATFTGVVATVAPATAAPSIVRTAAPSADQLTAKLSIALNPGNSRSARAAELEAGEAGLAQLDGIAGLINSFPGTTYAVRGPVSDNGDTVSAVLVVTAVGYGDLRPIDVSWRQIDGTYKLTRDAQCVIGHNTGVPCSF